MQHSIPLFTIFMLLICITNRFPIKDINRFPTKDTNRFPKNTCFPHSRSIGCCFTSSFFVHISLNTHKKLEGTLAVILVSDFLSYISLSLLLRSNKSCTETLLPGTQARKTNDAVI